MTASDRHIEALFRPLHQLARRANDKTPTVLETIETQLLAAAQRNRTGSSRQRDGYPSGQLGAGGDDAGTTVETAAIANLHKPTPDPIDDHVEAAVGYLQDAVLAIGALRSRLALIDHLSTTRRTSNPPAHCQACDRLVTCTSDDPIRAGYCSSCSRAFYRFCDTERDQGRDPDRARFERERRANPAA